jgi:nicotinate phosphoribosyltransferase
MRSTALLTDHYELTMLDAALGDGTAHRPCAFEAFARRLPEGRRFGVVAGTARLLEAIEAFRFGDDELAYLADHTIVSDTTVEWLSSYRFSGDVVGYREGELHMAGSPVLTVVAPFGEAVVLETLVLSVLNYDSAVAAAAARMVAAADGRSLLEFGSRRAHEEAAVAAARAAYVAGFSGTSNLEAGRRHGIPTLGTSAHAYTLVHDDEPAAFAGQVAALGPHTTLLVDTYDIPDGLANALAAAGTDLGGVRIDSGDLAEEARRARRYLDEHAATDTRIVLSGSLDEFQLVALRDAPADSYGVGTKLVTGSGAPTAEFVYKLVARAVEPDAPLEPVAKSGGEKATVGGRKAAWRRRRDGVADAEILRPWEADAPDGDVRPLQVDLIRDGEVVHRPSLDDICAHHRSAIAELAPEALDVEPGEPALPLLDEDLPDEACPTDPPATTESQEVLT